MSYLYHPIIFPSVAKREGCSKPPPGVPYSPIVFPDLLIDKRIPGQLITYLGWDGEPVQCLADAVYVIYPNNLPPPPGFRQIGGHPPEADMETWDEVASAVSNALYTPPPRSVPIIPAVPQQIAETQSPLPADPQRPAGVQQPEPQEATELTDQMQLVETPDGFALVPAKTTRRVPASNYVIREVTILHRLYANEAKNRTFVRLMLYIIMPGSHTVTTVDIPIDGLDTMVSQIGKEVPTAIAHPAAKKMFTQLLPVWVREHLANCQRRYVYHDSGWVLPPKCGWCYVHADAVPPSDHVRFETDFRFGMTGNGHAHGWLVQNSWRLLSLSKDPPTILIPFLFAHLALMRTLFDFAGHPPHVLLFIKGLTGSLKTAVASLLFNFSANTKNSIPASFRDTSASMEVKMSAYKDRVLLVDDFCPAASENARRILEQNPEQLIKFYSDGIAKARTNPKMEETYEKRPHGLCAITGENSAGSYSSLLRCLFVTVQPSTYDKALLAEFQADPTVWTECLKVFVNFCVKNANDIISFVQAQFPVPRERAAQVISERRLVDAYVCLSLTAKIVLDFVAPYLSMPDEDKSTTYAQFDAVLLECCRRSAEEAKEVDPVQVFACIVCEGIDKNTLLLTKRLEVEASPDKFHGYTDGNFWHFWPNELLDFVRCSYELSGKKFPLSTTRLWEALYQAKILVPTKPRGVGEGKFEYGVRAGFGSRPRMIRIDPVVLKNSL